MNQLLPDSGNFRLDRKVASGENQIPFYAGWGQASFIRFSNVLQSSTPTDSKIQLFLDDLN